MATSVISIYNNIRQTVSKETIDIERFINDIRFGKWEDIVNPIRILKDYEERKKAKLQVPYVTLSGYFSSERNAKSITNHSGFIGIDIDNISNELNGIKSLLSTDPYVYGCFMSISGTGLCVLFKIDGERHLDAFNSIADYLIKKYQIVIDPSGKDVCRPRFISYDPEAYLNTDAIVFKKYLPKEKKRKIQSTIFVKSEFDDVVKKMVDANVSCVEDYRDWLAVGFGLADYFGEAGREYFHLLSSCSGKYERSMCDRQFTHCLRQPQSTGKITIATIYYFAKQAGINIFSEKTKRIAAVTSSQKKAGLSANQIAENLEKFEGIKKQEAEAIIKQAFQSNSDFATNTSLVENIRSHLKHTYNLKFNTISRRIELNGKDLDDKVINTLFLDAKVIFDDLTFDMFYRVLTSNNTESYNPILSWFEENKDLPCSGTIDEFFQCFDTDDDLLYFGKKWLVSVVSSAMGIHSPLVLIYVSEKQGTGKTEAFRRMMPKGLKSYYGESKLDAGKDDEILMTQKLIILDDEMAGKNKKEADHIKGLTSKQTFSLREPYGRTNVDLNRLAVLCGTTNSKAILNDPTGNRRFIPIEIRSIDFDRYNAINKDKLFAEAYNLYTQGFEWQLSAEDIERLNSKADKFQDLSMEYELINKFFTLPLSGGGIYMTATEMKVSLENQSGLKNISLRKIGMELKRIGFNCLLKRVNNKVMQVYEVEKNESQISNFTEPNPF
jgi:predicted P-loop ATPase